MIFTFKDDEKVIKKFDEIIRGIAFRENRKLDRSERIRELIRKDIEFNKKAS